MSNKLIKNKLPDGINPNELSDFLRGKNMSPEETMIYIMRLTDKTSEDTIREVVTEIRGKLSDFEAQATIELIAMAVEPVHPGITERLRRRLNQEYSNNKKQKG